MIMQLMRPRRLREVLDFAKRQGQKEKRRVTSNYTARLPSTKVSQKDSGAAQLPLNGHLLTAV